MINDIKIYRCSAKYKYIIIKIRIQFYRVFRYEKWIAKEEQGR
jgi:hypothetical protein